MDRFLQLQRLMLAATRSSSQAFRKSLAGVSALMCAFALSVGCGGSTGEDECEGDDCPALPGGQCKVNGATYQSGATGIPAPDGCNTCSCHEGELACTLLGCEPPPRQAACNYGGMTFEHGASLPSLDGCNSCSCYNGQVACTDRACVASCASDAGCRDLQYCAFAVGACGLTDKLLAPEPGADRAAPAGQCQSRPDACTLDYTPVCGCDGVTYGNACAAAHAGVNVQARGACLAN